MPEGLRHMAVAVAVIYDKKHGFLLWNNKRWRGYAFPMRHREPGDDPVQAALNAIGDRDFPVSLPDASAQPLECTGAFGYSEGVGGDTYYDYDVIEIDPGQPLDPATLHPSTRFGAGQRHYRFYLCKMTFPGVNLTQPGSDLERSLQALAAAKAGAGQPFGQQGYWGWFTLDQMRQRPDMSSDIAALLASVAEEAPLDTGQWNGGNGISG